MMLKEMRSKSINMTKPVKGKEKLEQRPQFDVEINKL